MPPNHSRENSGSVGLISAAVLSPNRSTPQRDCDHAITLKEGASIPNICPYRYPHYQKTEIEKIVSKILQAGIIRHSVSPFCSPIILVRKKDGGWGMAFLRGLSCFKSDHYSK